MLYLGKNTNPSNQFNEDRAQKLKIKTSHVQELYKKEDGTREFPQIKLGQYNQREHT